VQNRAGYRAVGLLRDGLAGCDQLSHRGGGELGDTSVPRCYIDRVADSSGDAALEGLECSCFSR
jgi:hypothetical protein